MHEMMEKKFTRDMTILEALRTHPRSRDVFMRSGMTCVNCMGAQMESIEEGARMHELDVNQLLEELNRLEEEGTG
jgi:hybrid cluster-associated redox disulfide protein